MQPDNIVLIVDDDADVRFSVERRLAAAGYSTRTASGGREALHEVAAGLPSVIVLDVRMPDIDGMKVLSKLQKNKRTQGIQVIMLSASIIDQERAIDAGARYFIRKPFRGEDLLKAVKTAIDQPKSGTERRHELHQPFLVTSTKL